VSTRRTEASAELLEDALRSALRDVLAGDERDLELRLDAPGLAELRGWWEVALTFVPTEEAAAAEDGGEGDADGSASELPADAASDEEPGPVGASAADASAPDTGDDASAPDTGDDADVEPAASEEDQGPDTSGTSADDDADGDEAELGAEEALDALEEEAEAAADFVEGLLDALDLPGDLRIRFDADHAEVEVVDVGSGALIGRRGQTLEAIQELLRCSLQREFQRRARVKLDVEGYRARRLEKLLEKADEAIDAVLDGGEPERLEPMDVFERKAVHHRVAEVDGLISRSQGREPARRVIIERG
jgi:spoIIIJ-associated protein